MEPDLPLGKLLRAHFAKQLAGDAVKVLALDDPGAAFLCRRLVDADDDADTPGLVCGEMGISHEELTLLVTDDPAHVRPRQFNPVNELLKRGACASPWNRTDFRDAAHFCTRRHDLVWKGALRLHGEEDVHLGVALGQCHDLLDQDMQQALRMQTERLVAFPCQSQVHGPPRRDTGRKLTLCVLATSAAHIYTPAKGDLLRMLAKACSQGRFCLVPVLKNKEKRLLILQLAEVDAGAGASGDDSAGVVLQLTMAERSAYEQVRSQIPWPRLSDAGPLFKTGLALENRLLFGLVSTTFGTEACAFVMHGSKPKNYSKFFVGCNPEQPSHSLRALPANFSFAKPEAWTDPARDGEEESEPGDEKRSRFRVVVFAFQRTSCTYLNFLCFLTLCKGNTYILFTSVS